MNSTLTTRRDFLKKSIAGGLGIAAGWRTATLGGTAYADNQYTATVAIAKGIDRADNAFRAMQMFKKQIAAAIGTKRVVIKVNFVWYPPALSCTNAAHVEGILEFLKSIGRRDVVIAESSATGSTWGGYDYNGYYYLTKRYPVKLMDLNQEGFANAQIWQYGSSSNPNYNTQATIRVSKMLMNPNNFIISAAPMKTHNTVLVTLATKNIGMGAPVYDVGNGGGSWNQPGNHGDKSTMHGPLGAPSGTGQGYDYQVLNDNVYRLVNVYGIRPNLAVIDGYQGMEHNGPVSGTAIATPQQLAVASLDWLAADRIALTLMGTNVYQVLNHRADDGYAMPFPACLNYLWQVGLGEWDDRNIHVTGDIGDMAGNSLVGNANVYNYMANDYQTAGYETASISKTPREGTIINPVV
jgi:uncharacterized protein (DUF362 family)